MYQKTTLLCNRKQLYYVTKILRLGVSNWIIWLISYFQSTGYYCIFGDPNPQPCPAGTYNNETGRDDVTDCSPCSVGQYCEGTGNSVPDGGYMLILSLSLLVLSSDNLFKQFGSRSGLTNAGLDLNEMTSIVKVSWFKVKGGQRSHVQNLWPLHISWAPWFETVKCNFQFSCTIRQWTHILSMLVSVSSKINF